MWMWKFKCDKCAHEKVMTNILSFQYKGFFLFFLTIWGKNKIHMPMCLTFNNLFRVIDKEFTEWWSLRPFESIQQLLDFGGHPATDRHAWTNINKSHCHKHANKEHTPTHALLF